MHDLVTGFFEPNIIDRLRGMTPSFASTINVINGGLECGKGLGTDKVKKRGEYYEEWLNFFGLPETDEDLDCGLQPSSWPAGSSSDITMYFDKDWSGGAKCKLVSWMT